MRSVRRLWWVFALLALAYLAKPLFSWLGVTASPLPGTLRVAIHVGLIGCWVWSLRQRIVHRHALRCLQGISALVVFWLVVHYVKWTYALSVPASVFLWYLYYVPIIFIPLLALVTALVAHKDENAPLPWWVRGLFGVAAILSALILTNDLHQLAFLFPHGPSSINGEYRHGPVFMLVALWCLACVGAMLVRLIRRARFLKGRQRLVLGVDYLLIALYSLAYLGAPGHGFVRQYLRDMTVVYCLLTVLIVEACLRFRLIPNNVGYERLFRAGKLRTAIYDDAGQVIAASADLAPLPDDALMRCRQAPVIEADRVRTSAAPIPGGYVVWQDDVSQIMETIDALAEMKEELEGENALSKSEYELQKNQARVRELGRIYDQIERGVREPLDMFSSLLTAYDAASDPAARRQLLCRIAVTGTYLKRRSNLILLSGGGAELPGTELLLCFRESLSTLEACGVLTYLSADLPERLPAAAAMAMYAFLEAAVEKAMPFLRSLTVFLARAADGYAVAINTDATADMTALCAYPDGQVLVERDEDEWHIVYERGGGA